MKRFFKIILCLSLCLALCACQEAPPQESTLPSAPQTQPPTQPKGQWIQEADGLRYRDELSIILTGWQTIGEDTYCFLPDGRMLTGWINDNGNRFYLGTDGKMVTGWQTIGNKRFYFGKNGMMRTGWNEIDGNTCYFGADGSLITGLMNIEGNGYFFDASGARYSGWLTLAQNTYYFDEAGIMAVGPSLIDGQLYHFGPQGIQIPLVNPTHPLPDGYTPDLTYVTDWDRMESGCADALLEMLADCKAAGFDPMIVSAYRTHSEQVYLFERKVETLMEDSDMTRAEAEVEAARHVAVPGTSEHQLGLAVDLIERNTASLTNVSALFDKGLSNEQIMEIAMQDIPYDIFDELDVEYRCTCSEKKIRDVLHSLGEKEILKMLDEQTAEGKKRELEVNCRFCGKNYAFDEETLKKLF